MQLRGFNLTIPEMAMVCLFVCRFVQISFNEGCYKRAGAKDDGIKQFFLVRYFFFRVLLRCLPINQTRRQKLANFN